MGKYVVKEPYRRLVSNACTHVGYIKELGELGRLVGMTDKHLVYTPLGDSVVDLGGSMAPDLERIVLVKSEAILLSTYAEGDPTPKRLQSIGLPIIYMNEWKEQHPLARAEWIRVVGALVGRLDEADSVFAAVCEAYEKAMKREGEGEGEGGEKAMSVMSGQDYRGTWYVPGGKTYMAQLFRDAGLKYRYEDDERESSLPLTTEQILREFEDADVWVGVQAESLEELAKIDKKHTWFRAYQEGRVYSFWKRTTPTGGNDFWETGTVHPDLILNDLRLIQEEEAQDSLFFSLQVN